MRQPAGSLDVRWQALRPSEAMAVWRQSGNANAVLRALCSHRSGYVRAEAVQQLRRVADQPRDLDALLVRCTDSVAAVRQAAAQALDELTQIWPEPWMPLDELDRMLHHWRSESQACARQLLERLDASPQLLQAKQPWNRGWVRHRQRPRMEGSLETILQALQGRKGELKQQAWRALSRFPLSDEQLQILAAHPVPSARREALRRAPADGQLVARLLLDPMYRVQDHALAVVTAAASISMSDLRSLFRGALLNRDPRAALRGLRLVGEPADLVRCLPFVDDPRFPVAREALSTIARLDPSSAAERLNALVDHPRGRVARRAADWLRRLSSS